MNETNTSMTFEKFEHVPSWAICYFTYGDTSNLTGEDKAMADKWLADMRDAGWEFFAVACEDYNEFDTSPGFGLPCATESILMRKIS